MRLFSTSLLCLVAVVGFSSIASAQNWKKTYNGSGNGEDIGYAITRDYSGNVYVTGGSQGTTTGADIVTNKYSSTGAAIWSRRYDASNHGNDIGYAITLAGGAIYVAATSDSATNGSDILLLKYNLDGNRQWVVRYDGAHGVDTAVSVIDNHDDGGVFLLGISTGATTGADFVVIKYKPDGRKSWVRRYDGPAHGYDQAVAISIDTSGGVAVAGNSAGATTGTDYAVVKYDRDGTRQWVRRYNGINTDHVHGLVVAESGDVIVTGNSWRTDTRSDILSIAWDMNGVLKWSRRYNGHASVDSGHAIATDVNGNIYVAGITSNGGQSDIVVLKYDSDGNQQWLRTFAGAAGGDENASTMLVDGLGNVYVTGTTWVGNVDFDDIITLKYDTDGNQIWQRTYQGTGHGNDYPIGIVQDSNNNIVLTGYTFTAATPSQMDYITISYAP